MKQLLIIAITLLLSYSSFAQLHSKEVLLITSAQVDLLSEKGKAWGMTQAAEEKNNVRKNLKRLLKKARANNIPVIHSPVGFDYAQMKGYQPKNPIQQVIIENRLLEINSGGVNFITEAQPLKGETILPYRQGFSSFWANTIQEQLDNLGVETIYIAGMLAEGCVASHTRDAVENGFKPVVISDAIGATSLELLDASYQVLGLHAGIMITTADFLLAKQ